eukprot:8856167-Ditylum_brightwellii.AAC.1
MRGQGYRRRRELLQSSWIFVLFTMTMILVLCHVCVFSTSSSSWQQQRTSKRESAQCWGAASKCEELEHAKYKAMGVSKGGCVLEPVIILHGLLGSKQNFASLGSGLAKQLQKKRKIVANDLRNHGE